MGGWSRVLIFCFVVIKSTLADSNTGAGNCREQEEVAHPPDSGATHPDTRGSRGELIL